MSTKLVFDWSPKGTGTVNYGTLTLNADASIYTAVQPTNASGNRWRDAQVAFQFDRPIASNALSTLTIGTYNQYKISPGLVTITAGSTSPPSTTIPLPTGGGQLLAPRGTIAVALASVTLQISPVVE